MDIYNNFIYIYIDKYINILKKKNLTFKKFERLNFYGKNRWGIFLKRKYFLKYLSLIK